MNYSYLAGFLVCLILLTSGAWAYSYYYPIEPDNKMLILGETSTISCSNGLCNYNYSITNNDNKEHVINISSYLTSQTYKPLTIKQINYKTIPYTYSVCTEFELDKNGSQTNKCLKTKERTEQIKEIVSTTELETIKTSIPQEKE